MRNSYLLLLYLSLLAAVPARALTTTFTAAWADGQERPARLARLLLENESGDSQLELTVPLPGALAVELPGPGPWRLQGEAAGAWANSTALHLETDRTAPALLFTPTAPLSGRILADDGDQAPRELSLELDRPKEDAQGPFRFTCPVASDGRWACEVPRGIWDLRLGLRGFAPLYLWNQSVHEGQAHSLGTLTFQAGASCSGAVVPAGLQGSSSPVTVELRPAVARESSAVQERQRQSRRQRQVRADDRGRFQFTDLEPGEYWLTARAQGFADQTTGPIQIFPRAETQLDEPIELRPPAHLELVLTPPVDPQGEPWRLLLLRDPLPGRSTPPGEAFSGQAEPDGGWFQEGLPAGSYTLRVRSRTADWGLHSLQIEAGPSLHFIDIDAVAVEGRLRWPGEPRPVALWFVEIGSQRRTRMDLEDEVFTGYLPHEGSWQVVLFDPATRRRHVLDPVEIHAEGEGGVARIDIDVPAGRLRGKVVDPAGKPVAGASVEAGSRRGDLATNVVKTDEDGHFQFDFLPAISLVVSAQTSDLGMAVETVELEQDLSPPDLTLTLKRLRQIEARVFAGAGAVPGAAVPGAEVLLWPQGPLAPRGRIPTAVTDAEGQIQVEVPEDLTNLAALVFPPGYAARITALPPAASEIPLPVDRIGGTLRLELPPPDPGVGGPPRLTATLVHGGAQVPLSSLLRWAMERGHWEPAVGHVQLPSMEVGEYTVCQAGPARDLSATPISRCRTGHLGPGGDLLLSLR